jgi:hypothetical protein
MHYGLPRCSGGFPLCRLSWFARSEIPALLGRYCLTMPFGFQSPTIRCRFFLEFICISGLNGLFSCRCRSLAKRLPIQALGLLSLPLRKFARER